MNQLDRTPSFLVRPVAWALWLTYRILRFILELLFVSKALSLLPCVLLAGLELWSESPQDLGTGDGPSATGAEFIRYKFRPDG